jgi:hypothetical protein
MERWRFPSSLVLPCRHHHSDSDCPPAFLKDAAVVAAADFVCHKSALGRSGNPRPLKPSRAMNRLGLTPNDLDPFVLELQKNRERMEAFLEVAA